MQCGRADGRAPPRLIRSNSHDEPFSSHPRCPVRALPRPLLFGPAVRSTSAASAAAAQTVVNPTTLQFTASPDHNTVTNGTPVVSGYSLSFYAVGGTAALASFNLGKPTPDASGLITVNLTSIVTIWPPRRRDVRSTCHRCRPWRVLVQCPIERFHHHGRDDQLHLQPRIDVGVARVCGIDRNRLGSRWHGLHLDRSEQRDVVDASRPAPTDLARALFRFPHRQIRQPRHAPELSRSRERHSR